MCRANLLDKYRETIQKICDHRKVDFDDLFSKNKTNQIAITRAIVFAYLHNKLKVSGDSLSTMFGRSRVNILRSIRNLRNMATYNKPIRQEWYDVCAIFKED